MKTWMIVKMETLAIIGSYESEESKDSSAHFSHLLVSPNCMHLEVPEGMDAASVAPVLVAADPEAEPPVLEHYELQLDATLVAANAVKSKEAQILTAYNLMNVEVYAEMAVVFKTTNPSSASAYYETWKKMKEVPAMFSGEGLTSEREVLDANEDVLFAEGAALDTNQKVIDYATRLLELADDYSVYRMKRIKQFRDERVAILAG